MAKAIAPATVALTLIALLAIRSGPVMETIASNQVAIEIVRPMLRGDKDAQLTSQLSQARHWHTTMRLAGTYEAQRGNLVQADSYLSKALEGSVMEVSAVRRLRPEARELAERAYQLYPSEPGAASWLADVLSSSDPTRALSLYQEAVARVPDDNLTWEKVGALAREQGRADVALHALDRACMINPIRNGSCHWAARISYAQGDWEKVIYYFKRGSMPEHPEHWVMLVRSAHNLGRAAEADSYLKQAQLRNPADYQKLMESQP